MEGRTVGREKQVYTLVRSALEHLDAQIMVLHEKFSSAFIGASSEPHSSKAIYDLCWIYLQVYLFHANDIRFVSVEQNFSHLKNNLTNITWLQSHNVLNIYTQLSTRKKEMLSTLIDAYKELAKVRLLLLKFDTLVSSIIKMEHEARSTLVHATLAANKARHLGENLQKCAHQELIALDRQFDIITKNNHIVTTYVEKLNEQIYCYRQKRLDHIDSLSIKFNDVRSSIEASIQQYKALKGRVSEDLNPLEPYSFKNKANRTLEVINQKVALLDINLQKIQMDCADELSCLRALQCVDDCSLQLDSLNLEIDAFDAEKSKRKFDFQVEFTQFSSEFARFNLALKIIHDKQNGFIPDLAEHCDLIKADIANNELILPANSITVTNRYILRECETIFDELQSSYSLFSASYRELTNAKEKINAFCITCCKRSDFFELVYSSPTNIVSTLINELREKRIAAAAQCANQYAIKGLGSYDLWTDASGTLNELVDMLLEKMHALNVLTQRFIDDMDAEIVLHSLRITEADLADLARDLMYRIKSFEVTQAAYDERIAALESHIKEELKRRHKQGCDTFEKTKAEVILSAQRLIHEISTYHPEIPVISKMNINYVDNTVLKQLQEKLESIQTRCQSKRARLEEQKHNHFINTLKIQYEHSLQARNHLIKPQPHNLAKRAIKSRFAAILGSSLSLGLLLGAVGLTGGIMGAPFTFGLSPLLGFALGFTLGAGVGFLLALSMGTLQRHGCLNVTMPDCMRRSNNENKRGRSQSYSRSIFPVLLQNPGHCAHSEKRTTDRDETSKDNREKRLSFSQERLQRTGSRIVQRSSLNEGLRRKI